MEFFFLIQKHNSSLISNSPTTLTQWNVQVPLFYILENVEIVSYRFVTMWLKRRALEKNLPLKVKWTAAFFSKLTKA